MICQGTTRTAVLSWKCSRVARCVICILAHFWNYVIFCLEDLPKLKSQNNHKQVLCDSSVVFGQRRPRHCHAGWQDQATFKGKRKKSYFCHARKDSGRHCDGLLKSLHEPTNRSCSSHDFQRSRTHFVTLCLCHTLSHLQLCRKWALCSPAKNSVPLLKNCAPLNNLHSTSLRRSQSLTRMAYQEAAAVSFYCKDVSRVYPWQHIGSHYSHWNTLEDHALSSSFGIWYLRRLRIMCANRVSKCLRSARPLSPPERVLVFSRLLSALSMFFAIKPIKINAYQLKMKSTKKPSNIRRFLESKFDSACLNSSVAGQLP